MAIDLAALQAIEDLKTSALLEIDTQTDGNIEILSTATEGFKADLENEKDELLVTANEVIAEGNSQVATVETKGNEVKAAVESILENSEATGNALSLSGKTREQYDAEIESNAEQIQNLSEYEIENIEKTSYNIDIDEKCGLEDVEKKDVEILSSELRKKIIMKSDKQNIYSTTANFFPYLEQGDNKGKYFSGKTNSGILDLPVISTTEYFNIVIVGDSISTGDDKSSDNTFVSGVKQNLGTYSIGLNNKSNQSRWITMLEKKLFETSNRKIRIYTRSIGGANFSNLQTKLGDLASTNLIGRDYIDMDKTWYQNIMDCSPNLIILSMGMNQNNNDYIDDFKDNFLDYVVNETRFNDMSFAFLTTPNPKFDTVDGNTDYTTYDYNGYKINMRSEIMACAKALSLKHGKQQIPYILDVARISAINRFGIDLANVSISNENIATKISVDGVENTDLASWNLFNSYLRVYTKKITPIFRIKSSIQLSDDFYTTSDAILRIEIGNGGEDAIFAKPVTNDTEKITFFIPSSLGEATKAITIDKQSTYNIVIERMANTTKLIIDGIIILQTFESYSDIEPKLTGHNLTFNMFNYSYTRLFPDDNFVLCGHFARYQPNSIDDEMFSVSNNSSEWGEYSENGFGGTVVHPSVLNITNLYGVCINEFVEDFVRDLYLKDTFSKIIS